MLSIPSRIQRHFRESIDDFHDGCPIERVWPVNRLIDGLGSSDDIGAPSITGNRFTFSVPMSGFEPADVSIRFSDDRRLIVSAKHERKDDRTGNVLKEFRTEVSVPEAVQTDQLKARLDASGYLRIEAPMKEPEVKRVSFSRSDRNIPIEFGRGSSGF